MILNRQAPLPQMIAPEPTAPEFGTCPRCRGNLVTRVLTVWESDIPGQTRTQCDRCHLIETPAMRLAAQSAIKPPKNSQRAKPRVERSCVRCGAPFSTRKHSHKTEHCSRECAAATAGETRIARGKNRPGSMGLMTNLPRLNLERPKTEAA